NPAEGPPQADPSDSSSADLRRGPGDRAGVAAEVRARIVELVLQLDRSPDGLRSVELDGRPVLVVRELEGALDVLTRPRARRAGRAIRGDRPERGGRVGDGALEVPEGTAVLAQVVQPEVADLTGLRDLEVQEVAGRSLTLVRAGHDRHLRVVVLDRAGG